MTSIGLAKTGVLVAATCIALLLGSGAAEARDHRLAPERATALALGPNDVIPTGNDWIALPSIRASDGALQTFNVISMKYRGLIEVGGLGDRPLMKPFVDIAGIRRPLANLHWSMRDYWIPTGTMEADGVRVRITYAAPPTSRAAIVRLQVTNLRSAPVEVVPGMVLDWGKTSRVTYSPEPLTGSRLMSPTPIDTDMEVYKYQTDDTQMAWGFAYVGSQGVLRDEGGNPGLTAAHPASLAPGQTLDMHFLIGTGLDEYSAAYAMRVLNKAIDRYGVDGVIDQAADDAHRRTRTTGDPDLDRIMNRNILFTTYFAWGRAIDTEQFAGMTARSNRYYVSAAYWDRDAMLWSLPALLDSDPARAREALDYALGVQGRDIGVHSRFIDGVVLEDGFELDELVAPIVGLASYVEATGDTSVFDRHREVIATLLDRLQAQRDPATGLYATFQDSQDEYLKKPFNVYDNVLTWRALRDLAEIAARDHRPRDARALTSDAARLSAAIHRYGIRDGALGAGGPIFAATVDIANADFVDIPPGSLMKLPALGFVSEQDPVFRRTYDWLHSRNYQYSYFDQPYGLPGSYRLPFTTSWEVADHLRLNAGRAQALKVLKHSPWDGGIITEGVKADTGIPDTQGLAFATAAGYVAHAICEQYCVDRK
ncbi:glycoside hydrolase family 125 protein [Sphingomonas sp.]|uniref:glycoside hydrolase family 125 protein n=1 Tax=Sphingomonas sp. TaxID=28214 RepID=UPI0025F17B44|nr:glycoside hydrolase family 125 protein [Sphingomonas sp.]MBV9528805.1 glycoside hydrolase family 125 protein [Sphingomonas sp.]